MTTRIVIILRRAEQDLQEATSYISKFAPQTALQWACGLRSAILSLAGNAESFPLATETGLCGYEIRECLYRTKSRNATRILFIVAGDQVRVVRVLRAGQDLLREDDLP